MQTNHAKCPTLAFIVLYISEHFKHVLFVKSLYIFMHAYCACAMSLWVHVFVNIVSSIAYGGSRVNTNKNEQRQEKKKRRRKALFNQHKQPIRIGVDDNTATPHQATTIWYLIWFCSSCFSWCECFFRRKRAWPHNQMNFVEEAHNAFMAFHYRNSHHTSNNTNQFWLLLSTHKKTEKEERKDVEVVRWWKNENKSFKCSKWKEPVGFCEWKQ